MIIYRINNLINGKFYIGKTTKTVEERWERHCISARSGSTCLIHKSIRKHGESNFQLQIIEYTDNLNVREKFWIFELSPHYNMTEGGDGGWINDQTGKIWKVRDSSRMGKAWKGKQSLNRLYASTGGNNYQSTHFIFTPWGKFETWLDAVNEAKRLRKYNDKRDVVTDVNTLRTYCKQDIVLNENGRRTFSNWRGKGTRELGFDWRIK